MLKSTEAEKRLWRKGVLWGVGNSIWIAFLLFLANRLFGDAFISPIGIIILVIFCLVSVFLMPVFFGSRFFRRKESPFPEYDQIEELFEKKASDLILSKLGEATYLSLYQEELNRIIVDCIRICEELLNSDKVKEDNELRFYLYARLANFYIKDDQFDKAIDSLKKALAIRSDNFMINFRIAEVYEWIGKATEAVSSYEIALEHSLSVSDQFKAYIRSEIERIETQGPLKKPPLRGLRYMSH